MALGHCGFLVNTADLLCYSRLTSELTHWKKEYNIPWSQGLSCTKTTFLLFMCEAVQNPLL